MGGRRYQVNKDGTIKFLDKERIGPKIVKPTPRVTKYNVMKDGTVDTGWSKKYDFNRGGSVQHKAHGGKISKYYKGGANIITGRD